MPRAVIGRGGALLLLCVLVACSGQDRPDAGDDRAQGAEGERPSPGQAEEDVGEAALGESERPWEGVDPEDVPVEREVHPDERPEVIAACIREQGLPATVTRDGGVDFSDVASEQAPVLDAAVDWCAARFPTEARYTRPLDAAQIAFIFRYQVEERIPCLQALGYETIHPPSEETYIANYGRDDHWDPFPNVGGLSQEEYYTLWETCPPSPPFDDLFPEE